MALVSCSECKKDVSDKAKSCPKCGAPINNAQSRSKVTRAGGKWEAIGFIVIVVGLILEISGQTSGWLLMLAGLVVFIIGRFK